MVLYHLFVFIIFIFVGKSTLSLVSFAKYEWFEEWKDDKVKNRAPDYKELKQAFIDSALEVVMDVFPKITRDKVKALEASSVSEQDENIINARPTFTVSCFPCVGTKIHSDTFCVFYNKHLYK